MTPQITWIAARKWTGYFAYFTPPASIIVYKYKLVPKWAYDRFVVPHELGHFYGVPVRGCLGKHRWCVMAEEPLMGFRDGSFFGKLLLLPFQLFGRGRYCEKCKERIEK